jgi:hypothetical protein
VNAVPRGLAKGEPVLNENGELVGDCGDAVAIFSGCPSF